MESNEVPSGFAALPNQLFPGQKEFWVFLFTDLLVIARLKKKREEYFKVKADIKLSKAKVILKSEDDKGEKVIFYSLNTNRK